MYFLGNTNPLSRYLFDKMSTKPHFVVGNKLLEVAKVLDTEGRGSARGAAIYGLGGAGKIHWGNGCKGHPKRQEKLKGVEEKHTCFIFIDNQGLFSSIAGDITFKTERSSAVIDLSNDQDVMKLMGIKEGEGAQVQGPHDLSAAFDDDNTSRR